MSPSAQPASASKRPPTVQSDRFVILQRPQRHPAPKNPKPRPQPTNTNSSQPGSIQTMDTTTHTCTACSQRDDGHSLPFLTCSRCANRTYCSQTCQESDWPVHRKACGASILDTMTSPEQQFFRSTMPPDFLHRFPEKTVYEILDDAYDLRVVDCLKLTSAGCESRPEGASWRDFLRFLDLAEKRSGLLPGWWSAEKRRECEKVAAEAAEMGVDAPKVNGHWVMMRYRDFLMPMKFRLLAERVYGTRVPVAW